MPASYQNSSPYFTTTQSNGYLDVWNYRNFPAQTDDILYQVELQYQYRPDLLAYDLYNDVNLWWVFASRNPDVIQDPIYDLVAGTQIYIPKITTLKQALGI